MKREIVYHIWSDKVDFGEKLSQLIKFLNERNFEVNEKIVPITSYSITRDKYTTDSGTIIQEFIDSIEINSFEKFNFQIHFTKEDGESVTVQFFFWNTNITVSVDSKNNDLRIVLHDFIKDKFGLSNISIPVDEKRAFYPNPTVFVGRHFDENSDNYYRKLYSFLHLLGFNVEHGKKHQSNIIPDKVKRLIDEQDIFIALINDDRDHSWISAESAYALKGGKHVILLVEEGSNYNPTIFGRDYEQIIFPVEIIEKSFIDLLQEFRSVGVKGI